MSERHVAHTKPLNRTQNLTESRERFASNTGVFRGARLSSLVGRDESRAPLKTPAWEAGGRCTVQKALLTAGFCTECRSETYWSVKPKLSLVRDDSSVRYEWLQIQWFYIFIRFQACYVTRHLNTHGMQSIRNILHKRTSYRYATARTSAKAKSSRILIPV